MLRRHPRLLGLGLLAIGLLGGPGLATRAQDGEARAPREEAPGDALLRALRSDPITAPYRFQVRPRNGQLFLSGRVGTKMVHDIAIRTAIAGDFPVVDELVIDTAEAYRVGAVTPALSRPPLLPPYVGRPWLSPGPSIYPTPLFARPYDPFLGMDPPDIVFPPWWGALSAARQAEIAPLDDPAAGIPPAPELAPSAEADDAIVMEIDPLGVAVVTGTVPTLADRIEVGQRLAQTPGVVEVINRLQVREPGPPPAGEQLPVAPEDLPDRPEPLENQAAPPPPAPGPAAAPRPAGLSGKVQQAIARRTELDGLAIRVTESNGVVTLSGQVPTAYEAMLAYRAAERTPGVRAVTDRLRFSLPDGQSRNPLLARGRPGDVEAYLTAQLRRQLGDSAHVDRVELRGDSLSIEGTIESAADRDRVEATIRSIPLLRGFKVESNLQADGGN